MTLFDLLHLTGRIILGQLSQASRAELAALLCDNNKAYANLAVQLLAGNSAMLTSSCDLLQRPIAKCAKMRLQGPVCGPGSTAIESIWRHVARYICKTNCVISIFLPQSWSNWTSTASRVQESWILVLAQETSRPIGFTSLQSASRTATRISVP